MCLHRNIESIRVHAVCAPLVHAHVDDLISSRLYLHILCIYTGRVHCHVSTESVVTLYMDLWWLYNCMHVQ